MINRTFSTKSGKKIAEELSKRGYSLKTSDLIAFCYTEYETDGYISLNHTSTGVKFLLSDINLDELPEDDIKVWATWTWQG